MDWLPGLADAFDSSQQNYLTLQGKESPIQYQIILLFTINYPLSSNILNSNFMHLTTPHHFFISSLSHFHHTLQPTLPHSIHQHPIIQRNKSLTPIKKLSDQYLQSFQPNRRKTAKRNTSVEVKYRFIYKNAAEKEGRGKQNFGSERSVELQERRNVFTPSKNKETTKKSMSTNESSKVKKLSELRKKIIKNLQNVETIETKYIGSSSPVKKIQQSDIIFKGSRDVDGIKPVKLTYEKQLSETKHETDKKQSKSQTKNYFYLVRKTDSCRYLIRQAKTFAIFGLHFYQSKKYEIMDVSHPNIQKIYSKIGEKIVVTEAYEYSLKELISMGRAPPENMSKIMRQVKNIRQFIEQKYEKNVVLASLCEIVFYVHGMIKILPLVEKNISQNVVMNQMHFNQ